MYMCVYADFEAIGTLFQKDISVLNPWGQRPLYVPYEEDLRGTVINSSIQKWCGMNHSMQIVHR